MSRSWPWLLAAVAIMLAAGTVWVLRTRGVIAAPGYSPDEMVRRALTGDQKVARKGRQAVATTNTSGKVVQVEAEVLTSADGRLRIEYVTEPLKGVTIWDDGDRTYRYNPKLKLLTVTQQPRVPDEAERRAAQLLRNYNASRSGEEKVAGHTAVVVDLHPRGTGKNWKRYWIDPEHWVILGSQDCVGKEGVLRSIKYAEVQYLDQGAPPAPEQFRPPDELVRRYGNARPGETSVSRSPDQLSRLIGFPIRVPRWVPAGYTLQGAYQTPCACSKRHQAARLEYTDGLNSISLFECGHPACTTSDNCFAAGDDAPLAYRAARDGYWYLAIGDAPRLDLERMVQSASSSPGK